MTALPESGAASMSGPLNGDHGRGLQPGPTAVDVSNSADTASPPVRKSGRPRSVKAHQAILDAAIELLVEEGFEGLSLEGVAARAGVGKTTIYRRWPSKEALIIDAVQTLRTEQPTIDACSLRDYMMALALSGEEPRVQELYLRLLPRFLSEATANPAVFDAYRQAIIMPRLQQLIEVVARAKARGEIRADVEPAMVVELFSGAYVFYFLMGRHLGMPPQPDFARQLIDALWHGIATSSSSGSAPAGSGPTAQGRSGVPATKGDASTC